MDKNSIKKYAIWAREELIRRVSTKAEEYGISKEAMVDAGVDSVNGRLLSKTEKAQRQRLIAHVKKDGYEQVIEEVAYTWFNRLIALRFMEVNNYLPAHVRVFTDENNNFRPQILTEALHLELDGLDMDHVIALKQTNDTDALYKYLLIAQCNALNNVLPQMFQKIEDYTELLFPDNILREGSVIHRMVTDIPENNWRDQVQIIGWLYQYYNSVPKDTVFANLKKNIKIRKEDIPAATQLFTPDWIVRYMVENSLGRLWIARNSASRMSEEDEGPGDLNEYLLSKWDYYLAEAEQEPEVQEQLEQIRAEYRNLKPEEIKVIDPCMGSGHILVYLFDVLMQIYDSCGYPPRDAVRSILENNLYGLDIDDRAAQLAYFSVMMKAVSYDSRFLRRDDIPQPHVHAILESNAIGGPYKLAMGDFLLSKEHQETLNYLLDAFLDAKEYGSLLQLEDRDYTGLMEAWKYTASQTAENMNMLLWYSAVEHEIPKLIEQAIMLTQKYHVVVTNPPYMAVSNASGKMQEYVKKNFPDSKTDLFACFIEKCGQLMGKNGYQAMITQHAWMFINSFEALREKQIMDNRLLNMVHLGIKAFEEIGNDVVQTVAFVYSNHAIEDYNSTFIRLVDCKNYKAKEEAFLRGNYRFCSSCSRLKSIPGMPFAYWVSDKFISNFSIKKRIEDFGIFTGSQNITGDNERFLRYHWEIANDKIDIGKWVFYAKGGDYRQYYGNLLLVIDWSESARTFYATNKTSNLLTESLWYKEGITYSAVTSRGTGFRLLPSGCIFDKGGPSICVQHEKMPELLALLNSNVAKFYFWVFNPSINLQVKDIKSFPIILSDSYEIAEKALDSIELSKIDWDSFETSWDFICHPLVRLRMAGAYAWSDSQPVMKIPSAYKAWELECEGRFNQLKANEEELNRIFIDIYGLQDELTPEVEDRDVTVRKADLGRDIRGLISYAVGCMFGRYSPYQEGLIFAGGEWDYNKFENLAWQAEGKPDVLEFHKAGTHFFPDTDNIIPICDDEYFADDIVGRFVEFISVVYGMDTLEENLKFIADALGGKGTPLDVIRNYFLNDFYADHCRIYQKRPIYWLFDSGKKSGFKALVYLHRYQPDLLARMRTDYVHEQQARYRTAIDDMERRIAGAATAERVKLDRQLTKLKDQDTELRGYEEKIHHLADQMIAIDLDDGVKVNYSKFEDVLAKIK